MNPEIQKRVFKLTRRNIVVISLITFILLMLAVSAEITYSILRYDRIYSGVFVNDLNAGRMSAEELGNRLKEDYQDKAGGIELKIQAGNVSEKINFSDLNIKYDISAAVNTAYSIGRSGNMFDRLHEILDASRGGKKVEVPATYDKSKVEASVYALYTKTMTPVKEADLLMQDDKITLRSGHHGENIDKEVAFNEVDKAVRLCKGGTAEIPIIKTAPSRISIEDYYNRINQEASDASVKVEANDVKVVPHKIGRSIEKSSLIAIAEEVEKTENTEKVLPVIFTQPSVKTEEVYAKLFKDTLATMTTQFYTGSKNDSNRGENIKLTVPKINGKILAPGDTFSFNDTVGERSEENGYKTAHTYVAGQIVDGIGGGICQVSTTLYNAVLYADLDVLERTNHMFTVAYVPLGRDASVSYDQVDFKFKNSTKWPIKIEGQITKDNRIVFSIKGTNESPGKVIEISPRLIKTLDPSPEPKYIDDPTLPEGQTQVANEAMKGYVVDTYKIVKKDGKVISETKLHTSVYKSLDKQIKRGTKKVKAVQPQTQPAPTPKPGVDEADNPPAKPAQ